MATKRKRVSKKNKKSWRKNVNIDDVENFLEDQRLEERLGVIYSEQKNEDLFQIDTEGHKENLDNPEIKIDDASNFIDSSRLKEKKLPKCFEILGKRTAVKIPIRPNKLKKKNRADPMFKKALRAAEQKQIIEKKNDSVLKKEIKTHECSYDVWSKESNNKSVDVKNSMKWLTNDTIRHTLQNIGKGIKKIPKTLHSKTSLLPAIETPHPGLSYNPSLKDHIDILNKVAEKELEVIKEEKHLKRVTTDMFSKITRKENDEQWLSEMSVGLTMEKSDSEDDNEEYKALNPPVRNKKKTLQKRRKLREALLLKEKLKRQKVDKKKLSDIYKLRKLNEIINKGEQRILKNIEKRKDKKKKKQYSTKLLSQIKYEEPNLEFKLSEELPGNLRNIEPEGNLIYDRFKSLQKRNILQPTIKREKNKAKVKAYERNNTKMGWESKGYTPFEKIK